MKILLIGPQGSGKSTQGKYLAQFLNVPFISTGDVFRQISSEDSEEGKRIKQILDSGQLVDNQTTVGLVKDRISRKDCANGFILDGYPRNLEQAKSIEDLSFDKVIYLKLPQEVVMDRLLKRGRTDDTKESIQIRLNLYYQQTEPLLAFYKNKGVLVEIDGVGEIENIQNNIRKILSQ